MAGDAGNIAPVRNAVLEALRVCNVPLLPVGSCTTSADKASKETLLGGEPENGGTTPKVLDANAGVRATAAESVNPGVVELDTAQLEDWVRSSIASGLLRGYFVTTETTADFLVRLSPAQAKLVERAQSAD